MEPLRTERLLLRPFELSDAAFIETLVNEPPFLRFVGDKGVRNRRDAERYLREGPIASYARHGHGLYCVERQADRVPLGMCGLVRRPELSGPDLGYGFSQRYWGRGYAREAAVACVEEARTLGVSTLLAITSPDNEPSARLLRQLGMQRVPGGIAVGEDRPDLYELRLQGAAGRSGSAEVL